MKMTAFWKIAPLYFNETARRYTPGGYHLYIIIVKIITGRERSK
jgi:hypothetical protein